MIAHKLLPVVILITMLTSSFLTIIPMAVDSNTWTQQIQKNNVVIDLNFYDDPVSSFEYVAQHNGRVTRIEDNLKSTSVFSLEKHDIDIEMRSFSLMDSKRSSSSESNKIYGLENAESYSNTNPVLKNELKISKDDEYQVEFKNTISGIKETVILNTPPKNLTDDLVIRSSFNLNSKLELEYDVKPGIWFTGCGDLNIVDKNHGITVYSIPRPVLYSSPEIVSTSTGEMEIEDTVQKISLSYNYKIYGDILYYEIIVPETIFNSNDIRYPLYIDPSITSFSGYSYYQGYSNGTVSLYDGSSYNWYPNSDRTVYIDSNVTVSSGETLVFDNVIVKNNGNDQVIEVEDNGTLHFINGTRLTQNTSSDDFTVIYKNGSYGSIINSTIEKVDYLNGFEIGSSDVIIYNSTFRACDDSGLYVYQSNPIISDSYFYNNDIGLRVSPFSNPIVYRNKFNDTRIGMKVESSNMFEDFSTSTVIEKLINTELDSGTIVYEAATPETNIALTCPSVTVDSEWSSSYAKEKMYDGITSSDSNKWSSDSSSEPHYATFDFQTSKNITKVKIYHQSNVPTYDYLIKTYSGSSWTTQVTVDDNTDTVTTHTFGTPVSAEQVQFYITDANQALDTAARAREVEIYDNSGTTVHYMLTKPINVYGDSIFSSLRLDKTEPGSSKIYTSVFDGDTNQTIENYHQLEDDVIDLKSIDAEAHDSIKLKFDFEVDGSNEPTLDGYILKFSSLISDQISFSSSSDLTYSNNVEVRSGSVQLEPVDVDFREEFDTGWNESWTITEVYDGGDWSIVEDQWTGSGNDLLLEGKSLQASPGHDGYIYALKYFGEVDPNITVQTHFMGQIDSGIYNYADVLFRLYDSTNSSFKQIRWTTRDYAFDSGLNGNTFNYVAQDNDTTAPITYDVTLNTRLYDLYEELFTPGAINWSVYKYFEFRPYSYENYNQQQNPKTYVDYFILSNLSQSGSGITTTFEKPDNSSWSHLSFNCTKYYDSDVKITLIDSTSGSTITGFEDITDCTTDISSLNNMSIDSIKVSFQLTYAEIAPSLNWITAFVAADISSNQFIENEIGLWMNDSGHIISYNIFDSNTDYGMKIKEERSDIVRDEQLDFVINYNIFEDNYFASFAENTAAYFDSNTFDQNEISFTFQNGSFLMNSDIIDENTKKIFINYTYAEFNDITLNNSNIDIEFNHSRVIFDDPKYTSNYNDKLESNWSEIIFIDDNFYLDLHYDLDSQSNVYGNWTYSISLPETEDTEYLSAPFYDCDGNLLFTDNTGDGNTLSGHVSEWHIDSSGTEYMTPTEVEIGDYNNFYLNMIAPQYHYVDYGYDSDSDNIADIAEMEEGKYVFEAEYLVDIDKQNNTGAFERIGDNYIVPIDVHLSETSLSNYVLSIAVRAKVYNGFTSQNFSVNLTSNVTDYACSHFMAEPFMEWYQTPWFTVNNSHFEGYIDDLTGGESIEIDKFMVLKKLNNTYHNPPVLSNPLDSDIDEDDLPDGSERTPFGFYLEAEHMTVSSGIIAHDFTAVNSQYIYSTNVDVDFATFNVLADETEDYHLYIRARDLGGASRGRVVVTRSTQTQNTPVLNDSFCWFPLKYNSLSSGIHTFSMKTDVSGSVIGIDRIVMVKASDIEITDLSEVDIPIWANAMSASVTYTTVSDTENNIASYLPSTSTTIDVYGNMSVYTNNNNLYGSNLTTFRSYLIETGGTISAANPSISMGEVVYEDTSAGDIYYCDLRKGPGALDPINISDEYGNDNKGHDPIISDGTVVWINTSGSSNKLYSILTDSWHFIELEEETNYLIQDKYGVYSRSIAWISEYDGSSDQYIRLAQVGIMADVQSDKVDDAGLTPHIVTVASSSTSSFEQIDIYGHRIVYLEKDTTGDSRIMVYDHTSEISTQLYPSSGYSSAIQSDKPIQIWGDHVTWMEDDGAYDIIKVTEIGTGNDVEYNTDNVNIDSYALYGGRVYYHASGSSFLKGFYTDSLFNVGDVDYYKNHDVTTYERYSIDFTNELNQYLSDYIDSDDFDSQYSTSVEPIMNVALSSTDTVGTTTITGVKIELDGITDPFSSDLDGDHISDGEEVLNFYNQSLYEIEDSYDYKEWIEPLCGDAHSTWTSLAASMYSSSPMFYPQGADLITGDYIYGTDDNDENLWVNTTSYLEYELDSIEPGNIYTIESETNQRMTNTYAGFDDFDFGNMMPTMSTRASESDMFGPSDTDMYEEDYRLNDTEEVYVKEVLRHIIILNYSGRSDQAVKLIDEYVDFNFIWTSVGKLVDTPGQYFDTENGTYFLMLAVEIDFTSEVSFGGPDDFKLEIRADLDLLPDELNPILADGLGEESEVPDGFPVDRFHFIRVMNFDQLIIQKRSLSPIYRDTDADGLHDFNETYLDSYPLSDDPDLDGIDDYSEIMTFNTSAIRRDTDWDSIRDSIELSIPGVSLGKSSSRGSYYERKMRNSDYFDLSNISNVDADFLNNATDPLDTDTDDDGIPDGWIDGWKYFGEYDYGYAGSFYSPDQWKGGFDYDNLIQVYEGEDLNLDGSSDGSGSGWDFDGLTFEYEGNGNAETDPTYKDSDGDNIPDGYEIWYATREPFIDNSDDLIIDPTTPDGSNDLDLFGYIPLILSSTSSSYLSVTSSRPNVAQDITISPTTDLRKISRIGITVEDGDVVNCIQIWAGDNSGPVSKLHTCYYYTELVYGDTYDEYIFKIPQGLFYNGLSQSGYKFFVSIPYIDSQIDLVKATDTFNTFEYDEGDGDWDSVASTDIYYTIYQYNITTGDGIDNEEEYIVGTQPKANNSDLDKWEVWNDQLTDGVEVKNYKSGGGQVLARTNVVNGSISFDQLSENVDSNSYYHYNTDPLGTNHYYNYTYLDSDDEYSFTSWDCDIAFSLKDGSDVTYTVEGSTKYLIVWDDYSFDNEDYWDEAAGDYVVNCSYIRFEYDSTIITASYLIDISYRGQDIYFSDPNRFDTDNDGLMDGKEIDWNQNSEDDFSSSEETDLGTDLFCNVRDIDSDNDGVNDGEETNFYVDNEGQGLDESDDRENMIDPDSDGDGLYDGTEHDWYSDPDHDGINNMEDPDSDNDGLCDGWKEDFVWDPKANSNDGAFVIESESTTFTANDFHENDVWKGEDENCDGIIDETETDPTHWDTDKDGLWDGFDVLSGGEMKLGEIYIPCSESLDDIISGFVYRREYVETVEQSESTDPLDSDSDDDTLTDGFQEIFCHGAALSMLFRIPTSTGISIIQYGNVSSDPSLADTDGDSINDNVELDHLSLPTVTDSDCDGIDDDIEIDFEKTLPNHCDSDHDQIPDGWVDGWWYDTATCKGYIDSNNVSGHKQNSKDIWEGEDLNGNGIFNSNETKPNEYDTDGDNLPDEREYFYDMLTEIYDPNYDVSYPCDADHDGIYNSLEMDSDNDGLDDGEEDRDRNGVLNAVLLGENETSDNPYYLIARETIPFVNDSDEDNVLDGSDSRINPNNSSETVFWKWDTDRDGLINAMDNDSDDDNITDDLDSLVLSYGLSPSGDFDNDGLTNGQEWAFGSDDSDNDTDDDGLTDLQEYLNGTNPKDNKTDDDSYEDKFEVDNGLNPNLADSDGDGLYDDHYFEGIQNSDGADDGCNALDNDSDNDGINDGVEFFTYVSNPTYEDTDLDGLIDGYEITYHTLILINDTDDDNLLDGIEIEYGTSPILDDTDFDGADDDVDFEPLVKNCEFLFTVRELILLDDVDDDEADYFAIMNASYKNESTDWTDSLMIRKQWFYDKASEETDEIIGDGYYYHESVVTTWRDDDNGERWQEDSIKTRNEMIDRWSFSTLDLPNDATYIYFKLMILDSDFGSGDDWRSGTNRPDMIDISPESDDMDVGSAQIHWESEHTKGRALEIEYNLRDSTWKTENNKEGFNLSIDENGPGVCSGNEDGNIARSSLDATISFDILPWNHSDFQNGVDMEFKPGDFDNDKLTHLSEYYYWHSNISTSDHDNDGMDDWFEARYGYNLLFDADINDPFDSISLIPEFAVDNDLDGINATNEYKYFKWGANPYEKDIFVEVDWYINYCKDEKKFLEESQNSVLKKFAEHNILLHIDDGSFGGGNPILFSGSLYVEGTMKGNNNDFYDLKWGNGWDKNSNSIIDRKIDNLEDGNFTYQRYRVFHYCIFGENYISAPNSTGRGETPGDDLFISYILLYSSRDFAATFMHELGHNLGLEHYGNMEKCPHYPSHQNGEGCPEYKSIMSYYYSLNNDFSIDYGSHPGGWNDWENLHLSISSGGD